MKAFGILLFVRILLVVISFLAVTPASADTKYCPKGYAYNQLANRCEALPQCSQGSYDPSKDVCVADAAFTCPSWYTFNIDIVGCLGSIPCDCGGTLYTTPSVGCRLGSAPPPCACGYQTTINDPEPGTCRKSPTCPDYGIIYQYNGGSYCYHSATITCPPGYYYWAYYKICYADARCPNGGTLNTSLDLCIASPYQDPFDDTCDNSKQCCDERVGKPVSVGNGKVVTRETDFSLSGVIPINFTRFYNSMSTSVTKGFGTIWGHNFDTRVVSYYYTSIYKVINSDGSIFYYSDTNGDRIYEADIPRGETSRLIKNADNTFRREYKDGTSEEFNTSGYMIASVDRNGNRLTLTRDTYNNLALITDPSGRVITIAYNTSGLISQITLPDGKLITYAYPAGQLQKVTYPDGSYRTYEYQYGTYNLTGIKNENGSYVEKHTYDSQNRAITSSADGTNELLTINYISDTQSTVTDSLGRVTTYTIDKSGGKSHATSIQGPGCSQCGQSNISHTYDANLNVSSSTDPNGNVATMTYDSNGNMLTKTEAYGTPLQRTTTYTYNQFGQMLTVTDPDGNVTTNTYDAKGNLLSTTDAEGNTTSYTYDTRGLRTSMTDANGRTTAYAYDAYGDLATITDPLNNVISYNHDIMGRILSMTDASGNQTNYTYDQRGRLTQIKDTLNQTTTYGYDPAGNLLSVTDAKGNITQFIYDGINRLIRETNPLGNQRNYSYNSVSNLVSRTDAKGQTTTYVYDDHNRLTTTNHPGGTQTTFAYDAIGNLTSAANQNISYVFAHDALNRKTSVTDSLNRIISYAYDARSNRLSMADPTGGTTQYAYNPLNLLTTITDPLNHTTSYAYDKLRRRTGTTLPNGISISYTYDNASRLLSIINGTVSTNSYVYNNAGNRTGMINNAGTHNYAYDAIYRLTQATHPVPPTEQFTYDPVGNRLTDGSGNSYFYNNANRLLNYNGVTFTYDANGNAITRADTCGTSTYTWDSENRLAGISGFNALCSSLSAAFVYDPFGRRIEKNVNGTITKYVYDEMNIIAEYDGNSQLVARYIHGPGIDEPIVMIRNGQTYYYHSDALGSILAITNSSGNVVQRYEYDAFGNIVSALDPNFKQPYSYTGREYDDETGLYFYRARYYDARAGRFISEDPIGLREGMNFYEYVGNNPVNFIDPFGQQRIVPPGAELYSKCMKKASRNCMDKYTNCMRNCKSNQGSWAKCQDPFNRTCEMVCTDDLIGCYLITAYCNLLYTPHLGRPK